MTHRPFLQWPPLASPELSWGMLRPQQERLFSFCLEAMGSGRQGSQDYARTMQVWQANLIRKLQRLSSSEEEAFTHSQASWSPQSTNASQLRHGKSPRGIECLPGTLPGELLFFSLPREIKPILSTLGHDLSDLQKMAYYVT